MRLKMPFGNVKLELQEEMGLPDVVRRLAGAYGDHPWDINNGNCDLFAEDLVLAAEQLGKQGQVFVTPEDEDLPGHCWVLVGGKHFDAETPEGVVDWRELPIFKRCSWGGG